MFLEKILKILLCLSILTLSTNLFAASGGVELLNLKMILSFPALFSLAVFSKCFGFPIPERRTTFLSFIVLWLKFLEKLIVFVNVELQLKIFSFFISFNRSVVGLFFVKSIASALFKLLQVSLKYDTDKKL